MIFDKLLHDQADGGLQDNGDTQGSRGTRGIVLDVEEISPMRAYDSFSIL